MPTWAWIVLLVALLFVTPWPLVVALLMARHRALVNQPSPLDDMDARFTASNGARCEIVQHAGRSHLEVQLADGTRGCCGDLPPAGLEHQTAMVLRIAAQSARTPAPAIACAEFLEHLAKQNGALR